MSLAIDPFAIKRRARSNPIRAGFTAYARGMEKLAHITHNRNALPEVSEPWAAAPAYERADTAVTPDQMAALMHFAKKAEAEPGSIVEIGSFRGVTAALLAGQTERKLYAVDPFGEYGGGEGDLAIFRSRTSEFPNITHIRAPSGVAATAWNNGPINFLFVDAVHDYVNTIFDSTAWSRHLVPNGYLAMHDVDNGGYPGTRLAAAQMAKRMKLACHIPDLIILQKA